MNDSRCTRFFGMGILNNKLSGGRRASGLMLASAMALVGSLADGVGAGEGGCVTAEVLGVGLTKSSTSPVSAIEVVGDLAYVLDIRRNMFVFDISDLSSPVILGSVQLGDLIAFNWNVRVVDGLAYLVNGGDGFKSGGLKIYDVSDPTAMTRIGTFDIPRAMNIDVADAMAYILNETRTMQIVALSDPELPVLKGSYVAPGVVKDVDVVDGIAYMVCEKSGLIIVDVSDAAEPVLLGSFAMAGMPHDIEVVGSVAYVTNDVAGLVMIDVLEPTQPAFLGSFEIENGARRVAVSNDIAHVLSIGGTGTPEALWSIGVADPQSPDLMGIFCNKAPRMTDIKVRGETAFLGVGNNADAGVLILDVVNLCNGTCPADINGDGMLNFFDISEFLNTSPDFNGDDSFNFFDVSDFLNAFGAGCP